MCWLFDLDPDGSADSSDSFERLLQDWADIRVDDREHWSTRLGAALCLRLCKPFGERE